MAEEHRYSDEEVREILRRAVERQQERDNQLTHAELEAAAREIGIDSDTLSRAAEEVRSVAMRKRKRSERRKRERLKYMQSLLTFAFMTTLLYFVDVFTPGGPWFHWVLLIWGTIMAIKGAKLFLPGAIERRDRREDARERAQELREQRRREREMSRAQRKAAQSGFEDAVEQGVALLLSAAAKHIGSAGRSAADHRVAGTDFARYVADRKRDSRGGASAQPPFVTPPPRTRVASEVTAPPVEEPVEETRDRAPHRRGR